jgi:solute:Na+ symporter, SSS family
MSLSTLDLSIIFIILALYIFIGIWSSRKQGQTSKDFFLGGGQMPWWLLGVSMVATTFSADTPNLVTDIVRKNGVSGNWVWWAFLLTGMLTVFIYARLWRRSGVLTDLEFYEMRYGGKAASFLRSFRAIYLGFIFNVLIMAGVSLAIIKIGGVLLEIEAIPLLLIVGSVTVLYSIWGGLRAIVFTDFIQFTIAMIGSIWAAATVLNLPQVGGLDGLFHHPNVIPKMDFIPSMDDPALLISLFVIPLAVQWWSAWYPGSEPGGGGYIAQRMLSAKDENHSMGATLLFNIAHYAVRPWPWIIVALASLIIFPDLDSLREAFPHIPEDKIGHDLAYSAMLTFLPSGLLGLICASLMSAYMSTISTHLNWGSSYLVNDLYLRFMNTKATDKEQVMVGRISTLVLMIVSSLFALYLTNALQAFNILLQIGAGTGLIFILRWFWWRINAWTEISGMLASFLIALYFTFGPYAELADHWKFCWGVGLTTIIWLTVTALTQPESPEKLRAFYTLIRPQGPGWKTVREELNLDESVKGSPLSIQILGMFVGTLFVYSSLFATGFYLYGEMGSAAIAGTTALLSGIFLRRIWKAMRR